MKKVKKTLKICISVIIICICIPICRISINGYSSYKKVISEKTLKNKVEDIRNSKNYTKISGIDKDFLNAIVSVEDHRFYNHGALDFIAIIRASFNNILEGKIVQGGSTITQQLAKNMYFDGERRFSRKISELLLAFDIERNYTKDEILELYVNIINYGNGYRGIKEASKGYYNKNTNTLSINQAAMLAGLPQSPKRYNLTKYYNRAVSRQQRVLAAIEKYGEKEYMDIDYILAQEYFSLT